MGRVDVTGAGLGNALTELLTAADIEPGDAPSYQTCKALYLYHPLGKKMTETPVAMAQSQPREISVPKSPEARVRDKFLEEWSNIKADELIRNVMTLARTYGIASLADVCEQVAPGKPIPPKDLGKVAISFSVFDPLNTAGSLVLNQDPGSIDFQKVTTISVSGQPFHRSRAVVVMNERPIYIAYTSSAFGFVGRSVFQRALFPLKSFINSMVTDDLIVKKAGVFIAMLKVAGAIIDNIMNTVAGLKRLFIKQATNGNVISIGVDEKIETLNMQNIDGAYGLARTNILENIATAADMPAIIIKQETFAEGFGEGTEDARHVSAFVDDMRRQMKPLYDFMDPIVQRRAWNEEFYETIQSEFPEYKDTTYEAAFYQWQNSFSAVWPSYLKEPDSEQVKTDDVKLKAIIATWEVLIPRLDPENVAIAAGWLQDNINENKRMFTTPLILNLESLENYEPPQPMEEPKEPKPFAANDSVRKARALKSYEDSVGGLLALMDKREHPKRANGHLNGSARQ